MTNWEMCEEVTFRCPDCGHRQARMTPECPVCGTSRTVPTPPGGSVHEVCFGLNGGQRREWYRMVLTGEQAALLAGLPSHEAFDLFGSLWDQVVDASIDAGCDYEGMGVEVSAIVADLGTITEPCVKHNPK